MRDKNFLLASTLLLGTIIGAGIFGIPYVISKSGIIPGFFYFLILGGVVLLIHLLFGEIVLRTKAKHRLPGYAKKYLGKWGERLALFSTILGMMAVLLAYIILGGDFLEIIFSPFFYLPSFRFSLIFWLILSYFIFKGIRFIAPIAFFTNLLFILIVASIVYFALPQLNFRNFSLFNLENIFLPYGVILFALTGWSAVPEMGEVFKNGHERKKFKNAIILSAIFAILLYLLFTLAVVGVSGEKTSSDTFSGLLPYLSPPIIFLGVSGAVITLADSFLVIGLYLRNTLIYDYRLRKVPAFIITCGFPLLLFLLGFRQFIGVIGFAGTFIGAIEGILIVLIFKKAKLLGNREPEYSLQIPSFLSHILIVILILGTIFHFLLS